MKSRARKNQAGYRGYPVYNDQGVVVSAAKWVWHSGKGHWEGKTYAKTTQKRKDRRAGKRMAHEYPNH